jgi:hypothetical protein
MRRVARLAPIKAAKEPEAEDMEVEEESVDEEPAKVVTKQRPKGRSVAIPTAEPKTAPKVPKPPKAGARPQLAQPATPTDVKVGIVHTKAGQKDLYETQAKKYYFLRENGSKSYVTRRITEEKLKVYSD